jgi:hypothetical protein
MIDFATSSDTSGFFFVFAASGFFVFFETHVLR